MNPPALIRPLRSASAAVTIALTFSGCGDKPAADAGKSPSGDAAATPAAAPAGPPGTEAGAKELLSALLKTGADTKALTAALKPDKADYEAVFTGDFAAKVAAAHAPLWESKPAIGPKEGQTELMLNGVSSTDLKAWAKNASDNLPGGYEKIKDNFKDGLTVYAFKFVKPGEDTGMAFDGLVHVNGKWRIFPKPFRAAD